MQEPARSPLAARHASSIEVKDTKKSDAIHRVQAILEEKNPLAA